MKRVVAWIALVTAFGLMSLVVLGTLRYGGLEGFCFRVRAEIAALGPHDQLVPTPLPTATPLASASAAVQSPTATPSATPNPTPTSVEIAVITPDSSPTATLTPTRTASPAPTATPAHLPSLRAVELTGFVHYWQVWNNCGPATLAMNLSHFGLILTQEEVGAAIRPNKEDRHAGADELAAYARELGYKAIVRQNGTDEMLKLFLSNGLPVMMPTWHVNEKGEGMGHYRLVTGYSDALAEWILYDSLEVRGVSADKPYVGVRIGYEEFDRLWAVMNRKYIVAYDEVYEPPVLSILGDELDDDLMWQRSLDRTRVEVEERPVDAFAWFTLGTNLVAHEQWEEAAAAYDTARTIGLPYRMMWYQFGAFKAYYEVGRYEEVIALANATIQQTKEVEELHYWRGMGLLALGDVEGARESFEIAVSKRPNYAEAAGALAAIKF